MVSKPIGWRIDNGTVRKLECVELVATRATGVSTDKVYHKGVDRL